MSPEQCNRRRTILPFVSGTAVELVWVVSTRAVAQGWVALSALGAMLLTVLGVMATVGAMKDIRTLIPYTAGIGVGNFIAMEYLT